MTAFPSYSTGTVAIASNATAVVGTGPNWSGQNVMPGDHLVVAGQTVIIQDVTDATHLAIDAWPFASVTAGAAYKIYQDSPLRFVGAQAMISVNQLVTALNTNGFYVFVGPDATVPDPSLGDDNQYAFQATTGKQWQKVSGTWNFIGIFKGLGIAAPWNDATAYVPQDVVSLDGTSYVCIVANTNEMPSFGDSPPNAFWTVLAEKGDTGPTGPQGASYGGTSTTSLAIGTGSQAFTTQAGLAYTAGARVRASSAANTSNWMEGLATYSGTTLTVTADKTNGTGTFADWNLNVVGQPGAGDLSSANNLSDVANVTTARSNLGAGTVNSVSAGTGLSGSPNPITNSGTISLALNNATLNVAPANPTGAVAARMMGMGATCKLTPAYSGRIRVIFFGSITTAQSTATYLVRYGTGTAPSNGASATTGTAAQANSIAVSSPTAGEILSFFAGGIVTGLTPGTAYWFDMSLAGSPNTVSLSGVNCMLEEF